jgi:outer membrane protein OmpA-like peptidoglycan-associated protein
MAQQYDVITQNKLQWNRMPDAFDKFVYPGKTFDHRTGVENYRADLEAMFPAEKDNIAGYFQDIDDVLIWFQRNEMGKNLPMLLKWLLPLIKKENPHALMTTRDYLAQYRGRDDGWGCDLRAHRETVAFTEALEAGLKLRRIWPFQYMGRILTGNIIHDMKVRSFMKKTGILFAGAAMLFIACSSTEKKTEQPVVEQPQAEAQPVAQARSVDIGEKLNSANEKLAGVAMLALPPFKASAGDEAFQSGAAKALETAKSVEGDIPEGHVLQITGHGNRHPDESKRTGVQLSVQRAKLVYNYFVKNGFPKEKLSYRGVGSAQYDEKLTRAQNRRVTFSIVKAGAAAE